MKTLIIALIQVTTPAQASAAAEAAAVGNTAAAAVQ